MARILEFILLATWVVSVVGTSCSLCWSALLEEPPASRQDHVLVAGEDVLYLHGGSAVDQFNSQVFLSDLHEFNVVTLKWTDISKPQVGSAPIARGGHGMVLTNGGRLYVFGGTSWTSEFNPFHIARNDLHEYDPTSFAWSDISVPSMGSAPSARSQFAMAASGNKLFVHGGLDTDNGKQSDLHEYDIESATWTDLTPAQGGTPPSARGKHAMVVAANALYLFGGDVGFFNNDLFKYNIATGTWSVVVATGSPLPFARYSHGMAADAAAGKIYIYGGRFLLTRLGDLQQLDVATAAWTEMLPNPNATEPAPSAREETAIAYSAGRVFMFGGETQGSGAAGTDDRAGFEVGVREWGDLADVVPPARSGHRTAVVGSSLFLFGGTGGDGALLGDLRRLDTASGVWARAAAASGAAPAPRTGHGMGVVSGQVWVFGGQVAGAAGDGGSYSNALHVLSPAAMAWSEAFPLSAAEGPWPSPRTEAAVAAVGGSLFVFGGFGVVGNMTLDLLSALNDLYEYNTATGAWGREGGGGAPSPRRGHGMAAHGGTLYVFGGQGSDGFPRDDLHGFHLGNRSWSVLSLTAAGTAPAPRSHLGMAALGDAIYIFGGQGRNEQLSDLVKFEVAARAWRTDAFAGGYVPEKTSRLSLSAGDEELFAFGGEVGGAKTNLLLIYTLDENECLDDASNDCQGELSTCVNTQGSFTCECAAGYSFQPQQYGGAASLYQRAAEEGWFSYLQATLDTGSFRLQIPFPRCGVADIYVHTYSYITFGPAATESWDIGPHRPARPTLFVGAKDGGAAQVILGKEVQEEGRGYVLRFEAIPGWWAVPGTPEILWEATFFENGAIRVVVYKHAEPEGLFGLSDGDGEWLRLDEGDAEGTYWYTKPGCDPAGLAVEQQRGPFAAGERCQDVDECADAEEALCDGNATCTNSIGSFQCACNTGFAGDGLACEEVDECRNTPCHAAATCTNTVGSFACQCNTGYDPVNSVVSDGGNPRNFTACEDVDECQGDPCDEHATCSNAAGSYQCTCNVGFNGTGLACSDFDECAASTNDCDATATCTNVVGSFRCGCRLGYTGLGLDCRDIDECGEESHNCNADASCSNADGSFLCACNAGFSGNGLLCFDIGECADAELICHRNAECIDLVGSFQCVCKDGYQGDGLQCADIDECAGAPDCHREATCTNLDGDYQCSCNTGWSGRTGRICLDIDECFDDIHNCDGNATCSNVNGSFTCACVDGWNGDGVQCRDANECIERIDDCHPNATCSNTVGSFTCACDVGTVSMGEIAGLSCTDIDECEEETDTCHGEARCVNNPGSFGCHCNRGWEGSGVNCSDVEECADELHNCDALAACSNTIASFSCACNEGYEARRGTAVGTACVDVNECGRNAHNCHGEAGCANTVGSWECACNVGYNGSGVSCVDVDECEWAASTICDGNASCVNAPGSFECRCISGFAGDGLECGDVDECSRSSLNECHEEAACSNFVGGYACSCNLGWVGVNGFFCGDDDECEREAHNCAAESRCVNTPGSFECECRGELGFAGDGLSCFAAQDLEFTAALLTTKAAFAAGEYMDYIGAVADVLGAGRLQVEVGETYEVLPPPEERRRLLSATLYVPTTVVDLPAGFLPAAAQAVQTQLGGALAKRGIAVASEAPVALGLVPPAEEEEAPLFSTSELAALACCGVVVLVLFSWCCWTSIQRSRRRRQGLKPWQSKDAAFVATPRADAEEGQGDPEQQPPTADIATYQVSQAPPSATQSPQPVAPEGEAEGEGEAGPAVQPRRASVVTFQLPDQDREPTRSPTRSRTGSQPVFDA